MGMGMVGMGMIRWKWEGNGNKCHSHTPLHWSFTCPVLLWNRVCSIV